METISNPNPKRNRGSNRPIPIHRRTILDICRAARSVPSFPLHRRMQLRPIQDIRSMLPIRIGWTAIFARAYSTVCEQVPELREVFAQYPYTRLYRHTEPIASISIHRRDEAGEERLIFGRFNSPHKLGLEGMQQALEDCCTKPLQDVYGEGLKLERSPAILRRLTWEMLMNWSGRKRAKHVGTFSISTLAGQGTMNGYHPLVTSSSLAFGPMDERGECDVVLICDHRVIDGMLGAQALKLLENELQVGIAAELRTLRRMRRSNAA